MSPSSCCRAGKLLQRKTAVQRHHRSFLPASVRHHNHHCSQHAQQAFILGVKLQFLFSVFFFLNTLLLFICKIIAECLVHPWIYSRFTLHFSLIRSMLFKVFPLKLLYSICFFCYKPFFLSANTPEFPSLWDGRGLFE